MGSSEGYVHGYSDREAGRLADQAGALTDLLHHDTRYPAGSLVLEAGCGVGAQTVPLARNSPDARFVSVDLSEDSLRRAQARITEAGFGNVTFARADVHALPHPDGHFDHVFVCFLLEHLAQPAEALRALSRVLKPGGTITVIEGDHGSAYFHPDSPFARKAIDCLIQIQARLGGNSLIGRELYPLLVQTGWKDVSVTPRVVYADASRPELVEGFTHNTFTAMVEGAKDQALALGLMAEDEWRRGIADLYRTAAPDGTFSYTFFKAVALKSY